MSSDPRLSEILELRYEDRLTIARQIEETLRRDEANAPLTEEDRLFLDQALNEMDANPDDFVEWDVLRAELRRGK